MLLLLFCGTLSEREKKEEKVSQADKERFEKCGTIKKYILRFFKLKFDSFLESNKDINNLCH